MKIMKVAAIVLVMGLTVLGQISGFGKPGTDEFYPTEEAAESKTIIWPRLVELRANTAVLEWPGESSRALRVGDHYREWELLAVIAQAAPLAVLERDFPRWGVLAYVGTKGPVATMRKAIGRLDNLQREKAYPPEYFDRILSAQEDVLGQEALAKGEEPSYESVAGLLPPLLTYTFLGTTTSRQKVIVWPDGRLGFGVGRARRLKEVLFDPGAQLGKSNSAAAATKQGLIGRYLPVIDYAFSDAGMQSGWEEIAFATGREELETYVCLRSAEGKRTYWRLPGREPLENGSPFYGGLLSLQQEWEEFFPKGMQLEVPEARVSDSSKAAIVRALISEVGLHPKYGAGVYWGNEHDTFPPTTILLNLCMLDWGFTEEVKARLGYYLSHFVKQDGTFDYYGPAISEYGQVLALAARYVRVTGDTGWMRENLSALQRIAESLLAQMDASRKRYPPDSPNYGLLFGSAEADTHEDTRFYFSSDVWCWRGLEEMGQLLSDEGQRGRDAALGELGKRLLGKSATFRGDVLAALRRALRKDTTPPFLPPIAGMEEPFGRMTENQFASYTNYRYWPEMLSPGMLPPEMRDAIITYRTSHGGEVAGTTRLAGSGFSVSAPLSHGGEVAGTTRFEDDLDDWPYASYAWGLLEADQMKHYLLGFYGHLAYHQTPGTFTAYESVAIKGDSKRDYSSDYCVPAELVGPQLLRWMIAWEPWDKQELWLARAVPKKWFESGFSAKRIPTSWGAVNFEVLPLGKGLTAQVELASPHPELTVHIRFRPTRAGGAPRVTVEGTNNWKWDASQEVVDLRGAWKRVTIKLAN
jgi:hypothetical protein